MTDPYRVPWVYPLSNLVAVNAAKVRRKRG